MSVAALLKTVLGRLPRRKTDAVLAASSFAMAAVFLVLIVLETRLQRDTARLSQEIAMLVSDSKNAGALFASRPDTPRVLTVTATAYSPGAAQTDDTPWRGALGIRVKPGRTLAVSRDLSRLLGSRVFIPGHGFRVVEDLMHPRWKNRVDLCAPSREQAERFGVQQLEVVVLD